MDRRQQKTRKAIFEAFEKLLSAKEYDKITVQDIIDEANVGRTTFYAHFETKDSLLEEMCTELFDHVFTDHPNAESTHDFSLSFGDSKTIVTHILYHLRDNGRHLQQLLNGESSDVFLRAFKHYLNTLVSGYLLGGFSESPSGVPADFLQNHISVSFVGMVQWWLETGMKMSPEELSECFFAVLGPIL